MLYGRDAERAQIWALLEGARASRSGALVIRGEAGVGKSALLEDACERADDMRVLHARGVESEAELAFAALHQLLRPALHLIDAIPQPQAAALGSALGLDGGAAQERFLISAGCLSLLSELAEEQPVLCLVDDVQWLDTPAADALLFVARRLDAEGIVILFAARDGDGNRFEARDLQSLELSGLSADSAAELVAAASGEVAPAVRDLVVDQAGGNALALVELPAALSADQLAGAEPLPAALPLTQTTERLFLDRVRRLPESTQRALVLVAADDSGQLAPVIRAAQVLGLEADALTPAERTGLVSVAGSRVELRHPLVRSAVYQAASSVERRAAHTALAEAFAGDLDSDRRAWHRAAAAVEPDAEVAEALEAAAERAQRRSGHAAAASALERAAELSPDADSRIRRLVASSAAAWHAGQPSRATALAEQASGLEPDPRLRAELDHVRGDIQHRCGSLLDAGETLMAGAVAAASLDPRRALDMLFDAASTGMQSGDYGRVIEAGRLAAELPDSDDEEERFLADLLVGVGSLWLGTTAAELPLVRDVIARATFDKPRLLAGAAMGAGSIGDHESEAALLRRAVALARASGAVDSLTLTLLSVGVAGVLTGRFTVVPDAAEGLELAREAGLTGVVSLQLAVVAWFAAARGEDDNCLACAAEVSASAAATQNALAYSIAEWSRALLSLGRGRADEAVTRLVALSAASPGLGHPLIVMLSAPDLVEAGVRTGELESAGSAYAVLESFAVEGAPSYALALAGRCRALLAETDAADDEFTRALELHEDGPRPFDRARTQLLFGEHLRRKRRRVEAREQLRPAAEAFESLGAAPWAERARSELRVSGETARKRDPTTVDQLTPQELQISRFVAEGLTNKEIAAHLFLSPRTIDSHLRNVFAKLGLTSRTQLARLPSLAREPVAAG